MSERTPRPDLDTLTSLDDVLGPDWEIQAIDDAHFVINGDDKVIAGNSLSLDQGYCFLSLEEAEALVMLRNNVVNMLNYIDDLEEENRKYLVDLVSHNVRIDFLERVLEDSHE